MRQIKRLTLDIPKDAYALAQRGLLRSVELSEPQFREIARLHSDHIVVDGEAVLIAQPRGHQIDLHYAFPNRDAFVRSFPPMFGRIAAITQSDEGPMGYRMRLRATADRPYIEPVLIAQGFAPVRDWWRMTVEELPDTTPYDDLAEGFSIRGARPDDAEAIVQIDTAAFPIAEVTLQVTRTMVRADVLFVLEETDTKRIAGYLRLREDAAGDGYVSDLAVDPAYQRRGLGEAMLRWALARFRAQGYKRAALTVSADNGPAIALYRKLGFSAAEAGVDYRRPIDKEELRQQREKAAAVHIRVRGR